MTTKRTYYTPKWALVELEPLAAMMVGSMAGAEVEWGEGATREYRIDTPWDAEYE